MSKASKTVLVRLEPITVLVGANEKYLPLEVALEIDGSVPDKYLADAALDIFFGIYDEDTLKNLDVEVFYNDQEIYPTAEFEDGKFEQYGKVA